MASDVDPSRLVELEEPEELEVAVSAVMEIRWAVRYLLKRTTSPPCLRVANQHRGLQRACLASAYSQSLGLVDGLPLDSRMIDRTARIAYMLVALVHT